MSFKNKYIKIRAYLYLNPDKRTKFLIKHKVFKEVGEHFFFQPRVIPSDPKLIKFHDNVEIASNVTFVNHDIISDMLNYRGNGISYNVGCIEFFDNVFVGTGSIILPNIKLGPNVIVGAGSVVTKDFENVVIAGNPAKVICSFDEYVKKRKNQSKNCIIYNDYNIDEIWNRFDNKKKKNL